jgi:hypothetical protein
VSRYHQAVGRVTLQILVFAGVVLAADPPANIARLAAERETVTEAARSQYLYKQTVVLEEIGKSGLKGGEYKEQREVIFSPTGERSERVIGKPSNSLTLVRLTDEDFRDIREVQSMLLTKDTLRLYQVQARGEEVVDNVACWVLSVRPRQILDGQRLFEGIVWIDKTDYSTVRSEGRAMPQIYKRKEENLFPTFTTVRMKMEGGFWFPAVTFSDDTLQFSSGPVRQRLKISFSGYQRFGADTNIKFDTDPKQP